MDLRLERFTYRIRFSAMRIWYKIVAACFKNNELAAIWLLPPIDRRRDECQSYYIQPSANTNEAPLRFRRAASAPLGAEVEAKIVLPTIAGCGRLTASWRACRFRCRRGTFTGFLRKQHWWETSARLRKDRYRDINGRQNKARDAKMRMEILFCLINV